MGTILALSDLQLIFFAGRQPKKNPGGLGSVPSNASPMQNVTRLKRYLREDNKISTFESSLLIDG
jgi:hypothetical protein